ncbi:MAG: iron-sulfur cluster assembly scaffold protein [Thermodesulfobacteriota bacterium]
MAKSLDEIAASLQEEVDRDARETLSPQVFARWKNPVGFGRMENPDGSSHIQGTCGPVEFFLMVEASRVKKAGFVSSGCAATLASASMAVELCQGRELSRAATLSGEEIARGLGGLDAHDRRTADSVAQAVRLAAENALGK